LVELTCPGVARRTAAVVGRRRDDAGISRILFVMADVAFR
jgi:hypothetical protein